MDFLGNVIDWIIIKIVECTGATADQLSFGTEITAESWKIINNVWHLFIMLGIGFSVVFFLMEINRRWFFEGNDITLKTFAVPLIKLAAAIGTMSVAAELISQILGWNNALMSTIAGYFGSDSPEPATLIGEQFISKMNFFEKIIFLLPLILALLVTIICYLIWEYKAMIYKMELLGRVMFAPVAFADIYQGLSSTAVRYIKGTLALIVSGACMIILPKLLLMITLSELGADILDGGFLDILIEFLKLIVAPIAAIGVTGAAKQVTKEAFGA